MIKLLEENAEKNRTLEQIISADPNLSVWVGANAGTGKTGVLVDRILRLLLAQVSPSRILCLTFTKAAASEMSARLSKQLASWAIMERSELIESIKSLTGSPNVSQLTMKVAPSLFSKILDAPGGLKINTIHSFCESLLSRFPIESGIAPHFSVIDERTAAELRTESRKHLMSGVETEQDEVKNAFNYLAGLIDEAGLSKIINFIDGERDRLETMLQSYSSIEEITVALRRALNIPLKSSEKNKNAQIKGIRKAASVLEKGTLSDQARADVIMKWLVDPAQFNSEYRGVFLKKNGEIRVKSWIITKKIAEIYPESLQVLLSEQARIFREVEEEKAERIVKATESLLIVAIALATKYKALKSKRALIDYDDLISFAAKLLSDGRSSWVHYKLDGGIDHILVDESQDTSSQQWRVISALSEDFFSGEGAGDELRILPRTVFVVGDQKQSIFSFQGADPAQFLKMKKIFQHRVESSKKSWKEIELAVSFRSVRVILRAVDEIFGLESARDGVIPAGQESNHISSRVGQAGLIELWPTVKPKDTADDSPWDAPLDQLPEESTLVSLAKVIATKIKNWLISGKVLQSASRPIRPGDIMILVRKRGQFAEEMVRQLKVKKVPVAGSDRMILLQQIAVMDLIALGQFALLPTDDLNLAIVLKSPFVGLNDDDLFELSYKRKSSLWESLKKRQDGNKKFKNAMSFLSITLRESENRNPYEFFANILGPNMGRKKLLGRLGPDAADPIDEFMNLCIEFERAHPPSLISFLSWLGADETQIKRDLDRGQNEVRVMTVHGAKGLQANIVFLPDTCSVPMNNQGSRLYWKDQLFFWPVIKENEETICRNLADQAQVADLREYHRLLYVALTRAEDQIYVCGWENHHGLKDSCWYSLVKSALLKISDTKQIKIGLDEAILRLEEKQVELPDRQSTSCDTKPSVVELPEWVFKNIQNETQEPAILRPSQASSLVDPVQSPLKYKKTEELKSGLLIHKLLELLPEVDSCEQQKFGKDFLLRSAEDLDELKQKEILLEVLAVLKKQELKLFFGPGSQAEVPIMGYIKTGRKKRLVSGTLDRIIVSVNDVKIIDFKTDRFPPKNIVDVSEKYIKQMAAYKAVLKEIYGCRRIQSFLLWTKGPSLMYLDDDFINTVELD